MSDLTEYLRPFERVLWTGKPVKKAFVLPALGIVPFALLFMIAFVFIARMGLIGPIALASVMILTPLIWQILRVRNTEYAITDQRVIIQSGAIGKDTRLVDLDKMQETHVIVGMVDRWFETGSIMILTAGQAVTGNIGGDAVSWNLGPLPKITPNISVIREPYNIEKLLLEAKEKALNSQKTAT